jgi:hypothetical protein
MSDACLGIIGAYIDYKGEKRIKKLCDTSHGEDNI